MKQSKKRRALNRKVCSVDVLWHYTVAPHLKGIIASGWTIKPSSAYLFEGEKPTVWFSENSEYERTSYKVSTDPTCKTHIPWPLCADCVPHVRIGVPPEVAPIHWSELKRGMPRKAAEYLEQVGLRQGAKPWEWWGSYEPVVIPVSALAVEVYHNGKWVDAFGTLIVPHAA